MATSSRLCPLPTAHCPLRLAIVLALSTLIVPYTAHADTPTINYVYPAGGQRGTTVKFHVGGHYLHEVCPFEMLGAGLESSPTLRRAKTVWFEGPLIPMPASQAGETYPKDQAGSVKIDDDAPAGLRYLRVWTAQGTTPSLKFVVGDLPEIVEKEIDGLPIPVAVKPPLTINGRIFPREDVDVWTLSARAGETYTCEVSAARIGSPLDSRLEILGPGGRRIAENTDGRGTDSFLRFTAPTDGEYQVRIHDINFAGLQHYVYRLTITDGPYIDHVYPLGGRRGTQVDLHLTGQNVPGIPVAVVLPADGARSGVYRHRFALGNALSNPFPIELSDLPEHLEAEPNAQADAVEPVALPAVLNGRIGQPGDVDAWRVSGRKGEAYDFDLRAARLGSLLDSVVTLTDATGKQLAQSDDMAGGQSDSRFTFTLPAGGVYTVTVAERVPSRGGPRFAYRLHVDKPAVAKADFELRLPTDALTVNREAEAKFKITAIRRGGFADPIAIKVENLPAGVTVTGDVIPKGKNDLELKFKADKTAKIEGVRLKITGSAKIGEQTTNRTAVRAAGSPDGFDVDSVLLAVAIPTPFKVKAIFETRFNGRGATHFRHFSIDRNGFEGPITVSLGDRQVRHLQGVTGPTIVVPAGKSEFDYPIQLPPWMAMGRTSRTVVMAVGTIEEPGGAKHKVSYTSLEQADQIIVLVNTGLLSVKSAKTSIRAIPGGTVKIPVHVGRGLGIPGPVKITLIVAEHIRGVTAKPLTVAADKTTGTLTLQFAPDKLGPFNMPLTIRATAMPDGQPYIAEAKLDVEPVR